MDPVYAFPWVGPELRHAEKRPLIVGESHHGDREWERDAKRTVDSIQAYVDGDWTHRYFTILGRLISGEPSPLQDKAKVWNQLAFYNFVPHVMDGPGQCPTPDQYDAGRQLFGRMIAEVAPTHMLVACARLWYQLPLAEPGEPVTLPDREPWETRLFRGASGNLIRAMRINHPSWAMSVTWWRPLVAAFLALPTPVAA